MHTHFDMNLCRCVCVCMHVLVAYTDRAGYAFTKYNSQNQKKYTIPKFAFCIPSGL